MLNYSMLYPRESVSRRAVSLDGMWKFCLDWNSDGESKSWQEGIPGDDMIPVPASFQDFYTDKDIREYAGDLWYEKDIFVPGEWKGKQILVRFGAATHRAVVYVNGIKAAEHEGGFLPFCADVTDIVRYNAYNKVVVKVNNELTVTNIPCGQTVTLPTEKKMCKPYFDFFNYSGLQRSVWLTALPKESVFDIDTVNELCGQDAKVSYKVRTTGEHPVTVELLDAEGNRVASCDGKEGVLEVKDAHLWKVRSAYLYRMVVRIVDEGEILDEYAQEIGIRTVEVKGTSILINGEPVYLRGFGKHEDSDIVGRGFNIGVMKRDFELMKWIGANSFRTSHYPYSEEIYQMADREGFLIIDEVPAVGLFESLMNFMDASTGKQTAFFEKETTPILLQAHLRAVEEMITRDKNHPSVIAWSLLNEPETTSDAAVPYFKEVFDRARELDPQKRPRTFALVMNSTPDKCKCYQFSDIIALNRYYGWYVSGGYDISTAEVLFRKEMDAWKALDLNKPFIFTEYGADTLSSEHKLPSVMWSQEYQAEYLKMNNEVFDSYDFIKGEQIWNFADFQTTEGIMRVNGNKKGVFTRQRQPKDIAYKLKERWESLPLGYKG
ncbi:MAG TPA: beta-glucuronidase [Candidatus Mediterraneibacter norfolkensis]|nr:beta-glucuronidase [Candidatus Mediterraneibacter norfolkensis]